MAEKTSVSKNAMESFFEKRQDQVFYFSAAIFLILSLLSFDAKLSIGGDDASYIVRALRFIKEGTFPTFQGPLYPIFLSPFVALFGIKVNLLKLVSVALGLAFVIMLYYSLRKRVNVVLLSLTMLYTAFNSYLIYYSSQTYNEIFHLFMECLFIYFFFAFLEKLGDEDSNVRRDWKNWLLIGFLALLVTLSKNIGLAIALAIPLYFVLRRQFMAAISFIASYGILFAVYRFVRDMIWTVESPFSKQGNVFLYKDPYNFSKGKENMWGYLERLYDNTHIYLSKNLMKILHIRDTDVTSKIELISYIVVALMIFALLRSYKKNREIFFISLFTWITLGVTFIILQARWDSDRLVILVVPFMVLILIYALMQIMDMVGKRFLSIAVYILLSLLLVKNLSASFKKVDILTMKKNLRGERYHGYTPDWENYLKMSEWVTENLPEGSVVGVRKQTLSIIFANSLNFHSIARVPSDDADSLLNKLRDNHVTHIIIASLRRNPKVRSEYTINTVKRYASIIEQKYPGTFREVYRIGGSEEARLYEIRYPK